MNNIFSNFLDVYDTVYLDNIIIYLNDMSVYYWNIKEIFKQFCKTSLYTKTKKYKFYSEYVKYLKCILSFSRLTISNNKVKIIQD